MKMDEKTTKEALLKGERVTLECKKAKTDVTWSVDDPTLATIDANGVLTPLKNGTVTITCTSKDDPSVTASVTIEITGGNIPLEEDGVSQVNAE